MSNIHNITADAAQSVQSVKSKNAGLSRSRQDFSAVTGRATQTNVSTGRVRQPEGMAAPEELQNIPKSEQRVNNDIVAKALFEAGVEQNEYTMEIVNAHIKNFMPLNKENIEKVMLQSQIFKDVSFDILVMLNKAGIEITPENIAQMEKYVLGNNRLLQNLSGIVDSYMNFISSKTSNPAQALNTALLILEEIVPEITRGMELNTSGTPVSTNAANTANVASAANNATTANAAINENIAAIANSNVASAVNGGTPDTNTMPNANGVYDTSENVIPPKNIITNADAEQFVRLAGRLEGSEKYTLQALANNLKSLSDNIENVRQILKNGTELPPERQNYLNESLKSLYALQSKNESLLFTRIKELIKESVPNSAGRGSEHINAEMERNPADTAALKDLLGSNLIRKAIKAEFENKWFIDHKSINSTEIKNKYNEINNDLRRIISRLNSEGGGESRMGQRLNNQTVNIRDNLNFIAQFSNEAAFIELPLKLQNQNINGELYVLSNKKQKRKFAMSESVNILLRMTLENIGELDVFLTLQNNNVNTKFLTKSDGVISVIEENIEDFRAVLKEKGYKLHHKTTKTDGNFDFAKDFINKNTPRIKVKSQGLNMKV